jgi:hypothetical protein
MNTFVYFSSDASIYKHKLNENLNTGFDEILEIENSFSEENGHHLSRALIKLDLSDDFLISKIYGNSEFFLNLKITESIEIKSHTKLIVYPLKINWTEGFGRKYDKVDADGVTWITRDGANEWTYPGGDFYNKSELTDLFGIDNIPSFTFNKRTSDVSFNITEYVNIWNLGIIENNGVVIMFENETTSACGKLSFFSKDTNTIYQPYLRIATDDYIFNPCGCKKIESVVCTYESSQDLKSGIIDNITSGSSNFSSGSYNLTSGSECNLNEINDNQVENSLLEYSVQNMKPSINFIGHDNIFISPIGVKLNNSVREQQRIRVKVRDKYPLKKFDKRARYTDINFIDQSMYYSVIDADTFERVILFDKFTKISCDADGHYFDFDFGCLSIDRIYYFEIRLESETQIKMFEDEVRFKVVR